MPPGTTPLVHNVVYDLKQLATKTEKTWYFYVLGVMMVFAWAFTLRCSEYTECKHWDAPTVKQISFSKSKNGTKVLKYKLDRRKNNPHGIVEPIAIPCTCKEFKLCGYHAILYYIKECNKRKIKTKYLFAYLYNGKWKPFSDVTFRRELKKLFIKKFGKAYDPKKHRAHGFRYGGITDLGSIGIPLEYIRRISGHAPDSKVLMLYLKLAPETVAQLIKERTNGSKKEIREFKKRWGLKI